MKRLILTSSFVVLLTPCVISAHDFGRGRNPHRRIGADQIATAGVVAAAMIGAVGYLVLRKRTAE